MEQFNKFQVLTVAIILMFIFTVAAIYINTKEVSKNKADANSAVKIEKTVRGEAGGQSITPVKLEEIYTLIDELKERISDLEDEVNKTSSKPTSACSIYGVMTDNGPEQAPPSVAIEKARDNDLELVLSCEY